MSFTLSILTPSGKAFEGVVDSLAAPGLEGGFEVYGQHAAFIAALKAGELKVRQSSGSTSFNIDSGILEVLPNHNVQVLADRILT